MKDNMDILLLAGMRTLEGDHLRKAIQATFAAQHTYPTLMEMPKPPPGWERPFLRVAAEVAADPGSRGCPIAVSQPGPE